MRVLHLTSSFPRSAGDHVAPFLLDLARAQQRAGLEVHVLAPHDAGVPRSGDLVDLGVRQLPEQGQGQPDEAERDDGEGGGADQGVEPAGRTQVGGQTGLLDRRRGPAITGMARSQATTPDR